MLIRLVILLLYFSRYATNAHPVVPDSVPDVEYKPSVLMCSGANYTGECMHWITPLGNDKCFLVNGTALSIQPDNGLDCTFYVNGVCRTFLDPAEESIRIFYPGNADLSDTWSPLSYSCVELNTTDFAWLPTMSSNHTSDTEGEDEREGFQGEEIDVHSG